MESKRHILDAAPIDKWDSLEAAQAFYNSKTWKDLAPQRDKAQAVVCRRPCRWSLLVISATQLNGAADKSPPVASTRGPGRFQNKVRDDRLTPPRGPGARAGTSPRPLGRVPGEGGGPQPQRYSTVLPERPTACPFRPQRSRWLSPATFRC